MAKLNKLTAKEVDHAGIGKHGDGGGLWFVVRENGSRAWVFRYTRNGRERSMGLGPYPDLDLATARAKAGKLRLLILDGKDPITERRLARKGVIPTFAEAADRYHKAHAAKWTNPHHRKMWRRQLEIHVEPKIGRFPVDEIGVPDVLRVLEPIWNTKNETASRILNRIESILDWATAQKYREGRNPARWKGNMDALLPSPGEVQKETHYPALPWREVPSFMVGLRSREGIGARALEFAILTAARAGEVRFASWREIDLENRVWTIPAERMKAGKEHRVPLSNQAVELLKALRRIEGTELLFPSPRKGNEISNGTMNKVLKDMGVPAVTHGFRSSFRDWCAESTSYANHVAEMALAHSIGDKVEAAYRRGDLFTKRKKMMQDWADFCGTRQGHQSQKVVPIG